MTRATDFTMLDHEASSHTQHLDEQGAERDEYDVFADEWGAGWNRAVTQLMNRGFTFHEAAAWTVEHVPGGEACLALTAVWYRDAGFRAEEGLAWFMEGIDHIEAVAYATGGWSPHQAGALRLALHGDEVPLRRVGCLEPLTAAHDMESWWLATGIPPLRALRYVAAGYTDQEAVNLERRRREGDEAVDRAVEFLAALRTPAAPAST